MIKKTILGAVLAGFLLAYPMTFVNAKQPVTLEQKIEKSFPNQQIKDTKNFRQYSDEIMEIVAGKLNLKLDENIPKPKIIKSDELTLEEFNNLLNPTAGNRPTMCSYYFDKENIIFLTTDSKLDTLAHEFVHYFQVKYRGEDPNTDFMNFLEGEALWTQWWFEKEYMKNSIPTDDNSYNQKLITPANNPDKKFSLIEITPANYDKGEKLGIWG
ncbi:MAG: collagenase [Nanoarchaeota archaeon]|nr:collagenase [Nanoarchaeota archaeon]